MGKLLPTISSLFFVFPLVAGVSRFRCLSASMKIVCIYVCVASIAEITSRVLWLYDMNNLFLLHIYTMLEFAILSAFYLVLSGKRECRVFIGLFFVFSLLSLLDMYYIHSILRFNTYARSVECVLIMMYAMYYLYRQIGDVKKKSIYNDPIFIVNACFLMYFSLSLFLTLLSNFFMERTAVVRTIWNAHNVLLWIYYTIIGTMLWKTGRK